MPKKKKPLIPLLPEVMDFRLANDERLEKKIQSDIMKYLKSVPYSSFAKIAQGPWSKDGVSDIVGCFYGRSVVMEVKRKTTEPTALQATYLNDNVKARGFSAVVRSVPDAKEVIRRIWFQIRNEI
ncbi:MAG: hypothetical protein BA863_16500 [Desulfovibrio sp. S3730MH75]|nr:MAG: hypothetical protein BA863_16500 [Desulfovibrio sp. S3730MH75]